MPERPTTQLGAKEVTPYIKPELDKTLQFSVASRVLVEWTDGAAYFLCLEVLLEAEDGFSKLQPS